MNIFKTIVFLTIIFAMISCKSHATTPQKIQAETMTTVPSATTLPSETPVPPTSTASPTATITPTFYPPIGETIKIELEKGIIWVECVVKNRAYAHVKTDVQSLARCADLPKTNAYDNEIRGERFERTRLAFSDLRLKIGDDLYETRYDDTQPCCEYDLEKNGQILLRSSAPFYSFDPNRNLWNIGGQAVWELISEPPDIIVDGVHYNEKYGSEGVFFPYEIKGKLLFIAKENGKFQIVYDGEKVGSEYDEISMAYCCAMMSVLYGNGQYWFLGTRDGVMYVVTIE